MLLRWSIWGKSIPKDLKMLSDSISSFRAIIGDKATYLVYTDDPITVSHYIGSFAEILSYDSYASPSFNYFGTATWAKWCPVARLAPGYTEVHIDSDVFLLQEPSELFELSKLGKKNHFLVLQECNGADWQRGFFSNRISLNMPFINAGFFAQGPDADISKNLQAQFLWWRDCCGERQETFHDEQGGLTMALISVVREKRLTLLPKSRYKIISPRSNQNIFEQKNLSDIVLFHATYPEHPAWQKFKHLLPSREASHVF